MFRCKAYGPYIILEICEDGSIIVKYPRDSKVFSVKGKDLRALLVFDKAPKKVSSKISDP